MRFISSSLLAMFVLGGCRSVHTHENGPPPTPQPGHATVYPRIPTQVKVAPEVFQEPVDTISGPLYGHANDYSWLVGRLQRVHMQGGRWKIRYAPLDKEDRWGGSVVLAPDIRLDRYEDGDDIYVEGEILSSRASLYIAGPLYRIQTVKSSSALQSSQVADGGYVPHDLQAAR